jgi:ankyrin repeat protein
MEGMDEVLILRWACENNNRAVVQILLGSGGVDATSKLNSRGDNALHVAAQKSQVAVVQYLLDNSVAVDAKNDKGRIPLHFAAERNDGTIARVLLENGAAVEAKDKDGLVPLHFAAQGNSEAVRILLEKGSPVDEQDISGWMPLHFAADTNALAAAMVLLAYFTPLETKDKHGFTINILV